MTSHDLSQWRDDEILSACRRIAATVDPPPAHVTVAARAAFLARDPESITRDPESITRDPDPTVAPPMAATFRTADWVG